MISCHCQVEGFTLPHCPDYIAGKGIHATVTTSDDQDEPRRDRSRQGEHSQWTDPTPTRLRMAPHQTPERNPSEAVRLQEDGDGPLGKCTRGPGIVVRVPPLQPHVLRDKHHGDSFLGFTIGFFCGMIFVILLTLLPPGSMKG